MNYKAQIQQLLLEILSSNIIDEKISKKQLVVKLFKKTELVAYTPIAIKMNAILELKDGIDNFIVQDNMISRERLKGLYVCVSQLMVDKIDIKVELVKS